MVITQWAKPADISTEWDRPRYETITAFQDVAGIQIQDVAGNDIFVTTNFGGGISSLKVGTQWAV